MSERQAATGRSDSVACQSSVPALVQRECACGGPAGFDDQCENCRGEDLAGQAALQPKLRIGPADDQYERQADRVADTVMRMPAAGAPGFSIERITPLVQRQPVEEEEEMLQASVLQRQEEEEEELQAKRATRETGSPAPALAGTTGSPGRPLPPSERRFFEPRLGFDFSGVRVHTDSAAAASASAVGARAYTVGRDVVFGSGQWSPGTTEGRRLIAHELTHVVQQGTSQGRVNRIQRQPVNCTNAVTGTAPNRRPVDELGEAHRLALDWTRTALAQVDAVLAGQRVPMFIRSSLDFHFGRPNRRRLRLIRGVYRGMVRRLSRGTRIYRCRTAGSNDCLRCGGPPNPNGIFACTFCPSTGHRSTICPLFFQQATSRSERAITCVHEAVHAAGACGDVLPGSGNYPGRNPVQNAFSYEGFARTAGRTLGAPIPLRPHVPRAPTVRSAGGGSGP